MIGENRITDILFNVVGDNPKKFIDQTFFCESIFIKGFETTILIDINHVLIGDNSPFEKIFSFHIFPSELFDSFSKSNLQNLISFSKEMPLLDIPIFKIEDMKIFHKTDYVNCSNVEMKLSFHNKTHRFDIVLPPDRLFFKVLIEENDA
jgi:hypothetical protein